jgi:hypothetical protein
MRGVAGEFSNALGRTITYVNIRLEQWRDQELRGRSLPDHLFEHLLTMACLHAANRYDRLTHDIETVTGGPRQASVTLSRDTATSAERRKRTDEPDQ